MALRLLQAMAGAKVGGAEAFFERLTIALHKAGVIQTLLIRLDPERSARLEEAGLHVRQAPFGSGIDIATTAIMARIVAEEHPDVVVAWMARAAAKAAKGKAPLVGRLGGYYNMKYFKKCDWLVGNTQGICDYIVRSGWPRSRVRYLPNFVADAPALPPADIAKTKRVIVALGRLHPNKAFDVLLAALPQVSAEAELWLAGEGPEEDKLKAQALSLGVADRVRFLGWRQDAAGLIAASDVVVVPSRIEPLGNVILEAWAQRRPVVAAAASGPAGLIRDGVSGLLAPIDDADALAAALNRVLAEPLLALAIAEGGRGAFEANFTEQAVVATWMSFLDEVVRSSQITP